MSEMENPNRTITMNVNETVATEAARKKPKPDQNERNRNEQHACLPSSQPASSITRVSIEHLIRI